MTFVNVVPAILVEDQKELLVKIRKVEKYVSRIQIDIMDGSFVPNRTIQLKGLAGLRRKLSNKKLLIEAHMMVRNPEKQILKYGRYADIIVVHAEACDLKKTLAAIKRVKAQPAIAINPETSVSRIRSYLKQINNVLVMTVHPGFGGQRFLASSLKKVKQLRKINKKMDIEVDGGIKIGTAKKAARSGANLLVAGTSVFDRADIRLAITDLENDALF